MSENQKQEEDRLNSFILYAGFTDLQKLNSLNYITYDKLNKLKIIYFNQQNLILNNENELSEFCYLKRSENNFKTLQLNLKDLQENKENNIDTFVKNNFLTILKNNIPKENELYEKNIFYKIKNDLQLLTCIFEYLNTFDLINNISQVCKTFNEIIFYKNKNFKGYHLQLFCNRIINCLQNLGMKNLNLENIIILKKRYELKTLLQLYLYSGMFHLELFYENLKRDFLKFKNKNNFYIYLHCNPFLQNYLNKPKFKTLIFTNSYDFYSKKNYKKRNFTVYKNVILNSLNNYLLNFILECTFYNFKKDGFTISFEKGIPLYLDFLQNISQKFVLTKENCYFLLKMKEKAQYFIQNIYTNNLQNFFVTDDVLIGLHLILLTEKYYDNLDNNFIGINFTKLLQQRKLNDKNQLQKTTSLFPENLQENYFDLYKEHLQSNTLQNFTMNEFKDIKPFYVKENAGDFLQLHIFPFSEISGDELYENFTKHLHHYKSILSGKEPFKSPQSPIVHLFHQFYLLHPLHYLQNKKVTIPYFKKLKFTDSFYPHIKNTKSNLIGFRLNSTLAVNRWSSFRSPVVKKNSRGGNGFYGY
ncbi:hypothetical protein ABK040_014440 [Willaertia magna]